MSLYVGTSGWAYKKWKPGFYPEGVPRSRWLEHYASKLPACEINATFYRLQSPVTMTRWARSTPDEFRFAIKAHRRLTHARSLALDEGRAAFLNSFLATLAPLGPRLGALLFQLPPTRSRDDAALGSLLERLPATPPAAFEFRHPSWDSPEVAALLAEHGATLCRADSTGDIAALPEGRISYLRMRAESYTAEQQESILELLRAQAENKDVYVFTKHEGVDPRVTSSGVGLAARFRAEVTA